MYRSKPRKIRGLGFAGGAAALAIAGMTVTGHAANASADKPPLKVGLVMTYSGPFAFNGHQADLGIEIYKKIHGNKIAGREIQIIRRDDTGLAPDVAKRATQELAVRDKVDVIFGGCWSPNALASAPVATSAKIPFFVIVAASDGIPAKSPYMVRTSLSLSVPSYIEGEWAAQQGWKKGYNAVADYVLGTAAAKAFAEGMRTGGGEIVGEVRIPISNPDVTPYVQRIKEARPQVVQLALPAGFLPENFVKAFHNIDLMNLGINLMSGDLNETKPTNTLGDYVEGLYTTSYYVNDNDSPANTAFIRAYREITGVQDYPGFVALSAYDALNITRLVVEEQHGQINADKTMALLHGHHFTSPRGTIAFDQDGEIVESWYLRRAELVDGRMTMKLIRTFPMVHAASVTQ